MLAPSICFWRLPPESGSVIFYSSVFSRNSVLRLFCESGLHVWVDPICDNIRALSRARYLKHSLERLNEFMFMALERLPWEGAAPGPAAGA